MKYLFLIYEEEARLEAMSELEYAELVHEVGQYRSELQQSGHYITASPLQSVRSATTVRIRSGRVSIVDGPYAETKEQLGGFFLVEARDLNEAIRLVSKMPQARLGSIEVRPVKELGERD